MSAKTIFPPTAGGRWRRPAGAALLGALAVLALPPFGLVVLLVPAFSGLALLLATCRGMGAALLLGWAFGLGHFLAGLYWVGIAFSVAGVAPWAAPFAVLALAAANAVFPALALAAAHAARARGGFAVLVLATAWTACEWLRGTAVLGGFPWNLTGYAWSASEAMIQLAALTGVYGLSWLAVFAAAAPAALVGPDRRRWPLAAAAALLALAALGGSLRLPAGEAEVVDGVRLRLVQANIVQFHKWQPERRAANLRRHLELTASPAAVPPSLVIWPETATPYLLAGEPGIRRQLAAATPAGGLLITGAVRSEPAAAGGVRVWNSLHVLDDSGALVATYDKFHLVPFGEYVPLREALDLVKLTHGATDFTPGPGPRTLTLAGLPPVSPLICYEAIFPGRVSDRDSRPGWLLNVTNDAWYGISSGPYQHFEQARLRAVEEGMPMVRVANTGISGVVDPFGRVIARLELGRAGVVDSALPAALAGTLYGVSGDWPLFVLALVVSIAAWRRRRLDKTRLATPY